MPTLSPSRSARPRIGPAATRRWLCRLVCCAALAPAPALAKTPATANTPTAANTPTVRPAKGAVDAASRIVVGLATEIAASVASLRGLRFRWPVEVGVHDDASLRAFAGAELERDGGRAWRAAQSAAWIRLGLLPPGTDLLAETLSLLQAQVAGFYVPGKRALRIARGQVPVGPQFPNPLHLLTGTPEEKLRFVMAHELVHALGDQRWDLKRLTAERHGETDVELAIAGLLEGDATIAGLAWAMREREPAFDLAGLFVGGDAVTWLLEAAIRLARRGLLPDGGGLDRAPAALAETLLFPYVAGSRLVLLAGSGLRRADGRRFAPGFAGVDALYDDPPRSTEQVLHPERLLQQRDDPVRLSPKLPARLLPRGARLLHRDVLGELLLRTLLRRRLPEPLADAAADGWDGDVLVHYGRPGDPAEQSVLLWLVVFDSGADAAEALRALQRLYDPPGDAHLLRLRDALVLVRGPDAAQCLRLAQAALAAQRRRPASRVSVRRR